MSDIDRSPAPMASTIAVLSAAVGLGVAGSVSALGLFAGAVGIGVFLLGLLQSTTALVSGGAFVLLVSSVSAGAVGAPAGLVLVSVAATIVAWDVGRTAITIGQQLGRAAETRRVELTHALASLGVATVTAGLGFGIYRAGTGGEPMTALVLALVAGMLLVWALD